MCRVLSYIGEPVLLDLLLYESDNSLIRQSHSPRLMSMIQNLAGFGMSVWQRESLNPSLPLVYRTTTLPFYDNNLNYLSRKTLCNCLLAHVRGVTYDREEMVIDKNIHPFLIPDTNLALAHNGSLAEIDLLKKEFVNYIHPELLAHIYGTTDSEWIYALLLSRLKDYKQDPTADEVLSALVDTLEIIKQIRRLHNIKITSPLNLFLSNGSYIIATRFVYNYGYFPQGFDDSHYCYHSLWYTCGDQFIKSDSTCKISDHTKIKSAIISSEPITQDRSLWIEVPEYTAICVEQTDERLQFKLVDIEL